MYRSKANEVPLDDAGWEAHVENDDAGRWRRLTWKLSGAGLRDAVSGGTGGATRAPRRSPAQSILLLSDVLVLEGELLAGHILALAEPAGEGISRYIQQAAPHRN